MLSQDKLGYAVLTNNPKFQWFTTVEECFSLTNTEGSSDTLLIVITQQPRLTDNYHLECYKEKKVEARFQFDN